VCESGKSYGDLEVFRGINLEVGDAEIVAIVGPSGCGKTTLLRCIDGLIPMNAGEELQRLGCSDKTAREEMMAMFDRVSRSPISALAAAAVITALTIGLPGTARAQETLTLGLPAIPPVFITVQAYVAQQQKLFEKHGVKVNLRPFDSGANAARATIAGEVDFAISPTPLIVNLISNANAELVGIYGFVNPDWLLGSMDASKKCEDIKGQPVGVDSEGGARSIALNQLVRACGLTARDTQQVAMSSNVGTAMASGQLNWGVLHIDDVPIIERQAKKKVHVIIDINKVAPVSHYMTMVTTREKADKKKEALARALAAMIEATAFMYDAKNIDAVAKAAEPTGRDADEARASMKMYVQMEFWPRQGFGLPQKNIDAIIETQKRVGGIRPNATAVTYDRFADPKIFEDAMKRVGGGKTN
jgi:NitT/TauT family transport system substrate-binding protein